MQNADPNKLKRGIALVLKLRTAGIVAAAQRLPVAVTYHGTHGRQNLKIR